MSGYYNNAPPFTIGELYHLQLCGLDKKLRGKKMLHIGSLNLDRAAISELDGKFSVDLFAYSGSPEIIFLAMRNGLGNRSNSEKDCLFLEVRNFSELPPNQELLLPGVTVETLDSLLTGALGIHARRGAQNVY